MAILDYNNLFTVKNKPGVWCLKKRLTNGLLALYRYGQPDLYATVKPEVATLIAQHVIYTNEGQLPVEKVIDWLFQDSAKPDFKFDFDNLSEEQRKAIMEHYAPGYDSTRFKESHMSRIFKWFNELYKALEKV